MSDLFHQWGSDLQLGPTGDLAPVSGAALGTQRVLRRLLTNPGDYIWHLEYGAGLARFVGQPAGADAVRAVIRSQIFREAAVAQTPEPTVALQADPSGLLYAQLRYADAAGGGAQQVALTVAG